MSRPRLELFRTGLALVVLGAYALPLTVGIASQVSHELDHLTEELRAGGPVPFAGGERDDAAPTDGFVHAHGDEATHAHEGGIALLLVAAEHTEQQQSDAAVVALELVGHVPAAGAPGVVFAEDASAVPELPESAAPDVSLRPPLPPPRA